MNVNETLFISRFARYIFKKNTINNFFKYNLINFHDARLPNDAGGGYSWRIMKNDRIACSVAHLIDEGIDTGPIIDYSYNLFPKHFQIPAQLENFADSIFLTFIRKFLLKIKKGSKLKLYFQTKYLVTYYPRLDTESNGLIDWRLNSHDLINFINAFDDPYKGSSTFINNKRFGKLFIKKAQLHGGEILNHPYMAGIVLRHDKDWIVVSTNSKYKLLIEEVLDNNDKNILSEIKVGDRFYVPDDKLFKSKFYRPRFGTKGKI